MRVSSPVVGLVAVFVVFVAARLAGARSGDAMVLALPCLLPALVAALPAARRRRLVRFEGPVLVGLVFAAAFLLAGDLADACGAAMPWLSAARFAALLLGWIVALRLLHAAARRALQVPERGRHGSRILAGLVTVVVGFPCLWVALQTHRIAIAQRPAHPRARDVGFTTGDGVRLAATFVPAVAASADTPVVVVCHGVGANRAMFFGYAELADELGCHALAVDFRAHGGSGGAVATFGHDEVFDVAAAVDWLREQPELRAAPVVLVGVSMGAATALRAAALVDAAAVFAESSFADLAGMVERQTRLPPPFAGWVARLTAGAAAVLVGVDLDAVAPVQSLAALPIGVPVVLVHAGQDAVIPFAEGERLAAARPSQRLVRIDGAAHGACLAADRERLRGLLGDLLAQVRADHSTRSK
jgi:pimeloyl-ACP methyl ester carboxylesterase